jgi:hypothetical protein
MGIRINNNTWRKPLQLIDSWLPAPAHRTATHRGLPQLVQRFTRAGWLGRNRVASSISSTDTGEITPTTCMTASSCGGRIRVLPGARLVISGRMADVCAELDRLAALEHQTTGAACN